MFLEKAFDALAGAAQHPLAVGLYVLVVASWLIISWRVKRHRTLMQHLKTLPAKDRLKALELEMGPLPKKGLNAEQWLRAREQSFNLARWGIVSLTAIIILSLAVFYYLRAAPKAIQVAGRVTLNQRAWPNATLTIVGITGSWPTDNNGAFQFQIPALVKSDSMTVTVRGKEGYAEIHHDTTVAANAATALRLDLTTPPTQFIAGQVVEEGTGKPITDVQITLASGRGNGATDSLGYFRFNAHGKPFEAVEATLTHSDYKTTTVGLTISENNRLAIGRKK